MYCSKCGAAMADGAVFCPNCGQAFSIAAVARAPLIGGVAPLSAHATIPRVEYAGFWLRFVTYLIDSVVMGLAVVLVLVPLIFLTGLGAFLGQIRTEEDWSDAGFFLMLGFIHALMESSEWQATVGKKALGLVVTDMAGQRVSFARATGRHFGKIITNMVPMLIGYIMAGFTERKQALHDMIAGCVVLRRTS